MKVIDDKEKENKGTLHIYIFNTTTAKQAKTNKT